MKHQNGGKRYLKYCMNVIGVIVRMKMIAVVMYDNIENYIKRCQQIQNIKKRGKFKKMVQLYLSIREDTYRLNSGNRIRDIKWSFI